MTYVGGRSVPGKREELQADSSDQSALGFGACWKTRTAMMAFARDHDQKRPISRGKSQNS